MEIQIDGQTMAGHTAVVAVGSFALHIFYRAVQTNWPRSYMSASDFIGQLVSSSIVRYSAYRAVPVLVVSFFIAGSLISAGEPKIVTTIAVAVAHVTMTNGVAAWEIIRAGRKKLGFLTGLMFHTVASAAAILTAVLGLALAHSDRARLLLPSPQELSTTLWTAIAAAILGAYILRISSAPYRDPLEVSRRSIPSDIWKAARRYALTSSADPAVVKAIMVVENMQRPRWLRRMESIKARLGMAGTYGIMQVSSLKALDDESSIRAACEGHLRDARPMRDRHGHADMESVREIVRRHNRDDAFVELVANVYWQIDSEESTFRARVSVSRTEESAVRARNEGGGPARELVMFRLMYEDGNPVTSRSSVVLQLDQDAEVTVEDFEDIPFENLPETPQWEWPAIHRNSWLLRACWSNEDGSSGDSGWMGV